MSHWPDPNFINIYQGQLVKRVVTNELQRTDHSPGFEQSKNTNCKETKTK